MIDDEEYEKNKTFYLEIGEPRLVEMSEKKGGGCAPGLSPACVSLSGSLMSGTCNTSSHPRCLWKRAGARPLPTPSTACPQATRPGGEDAPALAHMPRGDVQPLPQPTISGLTCMCVRCQSCVCLCLVFPQEIHYP